MYFAILFDHCGFENSLNTGGMELNTADVFGNQNGI